jgi:hypothetical protein
MLKNYKIEIKWAFIFAGMILFWMLIERIAGLHSTHIDMHPIFTNFIAIPAIAVYVFALLDKRKNFYNGSMTYLQGFISGLVITVIVTILSPLIQIITSLVITPDFFQNAINNAVSTGKMEQGAAEKYFNLSSYILQGLIGTPVMGIITTAVVAIFTKRKIKPVS